MRCRRLYPSEWASGRLLTRAHSFQAKRIAGSYFVSASIRSIADRHTDCAASVESLKLWQPVLRGGKTGPRVLGGQARTGHPARGAQAYLEYVWKPGRKRTGQESPTM